MGYNLIDNMGKDNNSENNTLLGFNVKTLTSNKCSSKFLVIEPEEHPFGSSIYGRTWRD